MNKRNKNKNKDKNKNKNKNIPIKRRVRNKVFRIVNDNDGNDSFEVEAININDAAHKALFTLGWWVTKKIIRNYYDYNSKICN